MRQRLGRSGRRDGKPAVLRIYIDEPRPDARSDVLDSLNLKLVQSVAMMRLLIARWCEPPVLSGLHLSTLAHQVLAVIAERGGARPPALYDLLCRKGPFRAVTTSVFADLLRALARAEVGLIEQAADGLLLLGAVGERLADRYDFYAVFSTPDEFRVVQGAHEIGRLSMDHPRATGDLVLLAGRRWRIESIDEAAKTIFVTPSAGALPPGFSGSAGGVHDVVAKAMREVLNDDTAAPFLDSAAAEMLAAGRQTYQRLETGQVQWVVDQGRLLLFPWVGHRKLQTLAASFRAAGVDAGVEEVAVQFDGVSLVEARDVAIRLAAEPPSAITIAEQLSPRMTEKFHPYLTDELLILEAAAASVDLSDFESLAFGCSVAFEQARSR